MEGGSVVGVAEDVGDVGADGELQLRVDLPGILAAFVRVEQTVQTSSPVVVCPLVTLPIISIEAGHPPLLQGEDIGLVSLQVEQVYPETVGHAVLLDKERKLSRRVEKHFYLVQQGLVGLGGSDGKSEGVTVTRGRGFLWTEIILSKSLSRQVIHSLVGEAFPRHPGVRDGDLPVGFVVDLVHRLSLISSVAGQWVDIDILLVEAGYDLGEVVVVLL